MEARLLADGDLWRVAKPTRFPENNRDVMFIGLGKRERNVWLWFSFLFLPSFLFTFLGSIIEVMYIRLRTWDSDIYLYIAYHYHYYFFLYLLCFLCFYHRCFPHQDFVITVIPIILYFWYWHHDHISSIISITIYILISLIFSHIAIVAVPVANIDTLIIQLT